MELLLTRVRLLLIVIQFRWLMMTNPSEVQSTISKQLNPYPNKPRLIFGASGTFKLTIFSDLHYGENPWDDWGPVQDTNSTRLMAHLTKRTEWGLDHRRKWFSVFNFYARPLLMFLILDTFRENSTSLINEIMAPLNEARVPFSSTYGVSILGPTKYSHFHWLSWLFAWCRTTIMTWILHMSKKYGANN